MASIAEIRKQHPEYGDMSDAQLAVALHKKFYSDIPMVDYLKKVGLDRGDALYQLRAPSDPNGDYLRQQLAAPGQGETTDQARVRQTGQLTPDRRAGTMEGAARAALQGATFGFGDELTSAAAAALNPDQSKSFADKYGAYLSREQGQVANFRQDNPLVAYGAEIAGAIPTSMVAGGQLAGQGATLGARALSGGLVGAGQGAVYGFGSSDGGLADRAINAGISGVVGGGIGAAAPYIGNAFSNWVQKGKQAGILNEAAKNAPTASELKSAASNMFEQATGGTPLGISDNAYFRFLGDVKQVADKLRINVDNDPQSVGLLNTLMKIADETNNGVVVDMKDLHLMRQLAQDVAQGARGRDKMFGSTVINAMDNLINGLKPTDIVGGADPKQAAAQLMGGISTWNRANKVGMIEEILRKAEVSDNSQSAIIRGFQSLAKNPAKWNRFSSAEQKAITDVIKSGNLLKLPASLRGVMGVATGSMSGGPAGMIAVPIAGQIAKNISERGTEKMANRALGAVATQGLQSLPPINPANASVLEKIIRGSALPIAGPAIPRITVNY